MDENTGEKLYESKAVVNYLFKHYGKTGKTPEKYSLSKYPSVALVGTLLNGARGVWIDQKIIQREAPQQLLELWSFEEVHIHVSFVAYL